jgi:hypothetical protein
MSRREFITFSRRSRRNVVERALHEFEPVLTVLNHLQ